MWRKLFFIIGLLASGSTIVSAQQTNIHYGIKLGINLAAFRGAEVRRAEANVGTIAGLSLSIPIKKRWEIGMEAFYVAKSAGARYEIVSQGDTAFESLGGIFTTPYTSTVKNTATIKMQYLDVPLLLRYKFINSKDYKAFITFGGVFGVRLGSQLEGFTEVYISNIQFPSVLGEFFTPRTTFQVADDPINDNKLTFTRLDYGLVFGGGSYYQVGQGRLTFDLRFNFCFPDIEQKETEMRTGLFYLMFGYEF
jgi:hypothetical protein